MNIELPKDAEGREIPLNTAFLYDNNGQAYEVRTYCCAVDEDMPDRKWEALLFSRGSAEIRSIRTTTLYLTPPDSWEKLEENLDRASERRFVTSYCRYFNATNRCVNCPIHNDDGCGAHKDECAFGDILDRIRKLRGEDE